MYAALKEFGLSENEITVYIALLKAGETTANRVAELTGMKRSTTYDNLYLLTSKGIVSSVKRGRVMYYIAAEPKKIVHIIEERKEKIQKLIPALQSLQESAGEKTGVSYFEGKKGVLTVLNDILDQKKELWFYGSRKMASGTLQHYPESFIHKRAEKKIRLKAVLAEEDRGNPVYKETKIKNLSDVKFHKSLDGVTTNVFIYSDRVAFMTSSANPVGIIIKNKEVVRQQKLVFQELRRMAKY